MSSPIRRTKRGRKPVAIPEGMLDRCLPPVEAAAYLGVAVQTLAHDRCHGTLGVPYVKYHQSVRYRLSVLDRWLATRERTPGRRP